MVARNSNFQFSGNGKVNVMVNQVVFAGPIHIAGNAQVRFRELGAHHRLAGFGSSLQAVVAEALSKRGFGALATSNAVDLSGKF